jgi:predicted membrane metal-binding protein
LINPLIVWDVGFQLSFMAAFGLIVLVEPLEQISFKLLQLGLNTQQVGLVMALLSELLIITGLLWLSLGQLLLTIRILD